jgi:uncharacterized protein YaaN involved in tellurite resistance
MTTNLQLEKQELNEQTANQLRVQLRQEPQVLKIANSMDLRNQNELLSLGKEPAERLSRFSDRILNTMAVSKLDNSSDLLNQLEKVMNKFDRNFLKMQKKQLIVCLKNIKL